jgi:hypothetical protein
LSKKIFTADDFAIKRQTYVLRGKSKFRGYFKLDIDTRTGKASIDRIRDGVNNASKRIATELKASLDEALKSGIWETIGGAADIYDTGELLQSGSVISNGNRIIISYDAPHAALVHYGGYITPYGNNASEKVYLPPRPWIESVLSGGNTIEEFNLAKYYEEEIRKVV